MSIYKRGQTWHADITVAGRERFRGSLGTSDKATAQRLHDELRADLHKKQTQGHTWYEAVKAWLNLHERSDAERRVILAYDPGDIPLDQITYESFRISHHKPATHRRYANIFRAILKNAQSLGWVEKLPTFPEKKQPPSRIRWITYEEWGRLYNELPEHLKPPALFAVSTGLRQANVLGLEWSRVDTQRRVCWIDARDMKNRNAHGVPLSSKAVEALEMVKGQSERWCFTYRGNRIGKIKGGWERALKRAEIEDFTWHDLRHTWASWHIMRGTPLGVLQKLGGWKTLEMVMRYAHLAPEHLAKYADNWDTNSVTIVPPPS